MPALFLDQQRRTAARKSRPCTRHDVHTMDSRHGISALQQMSALLACEDWGRTAQAPCPTLEPKDQQQASLENKKLTLSNGDIYHIKECGASIMCEDQPILVARCLFNAAARAMGAARNQINKPARILNDTTIKHMKDSVPLRALFPINVMKSLRRPNRGAFYKDLNDRIRHFEREGWADDFELVGLAHTTGRAIHIWERLNSGRMNLIVIPVPPLNIAVDPSLPPIRLLRQDRNHYLALIAAALHTRCKCPHLWVNFFLTII